jgi:hypothetical protein
MFGINVLEQLACDEVFELFEMSMTVDVNVVDIAVARTNSSRITDKEHLNII